MIAFDPLQEHVTGFTPHVYITKFSVYNKELDCHAEGSPLKKKHNSYEGNNLAV